MSRKVSAVTLFSGHGLPPESSRSRYAEELNESQNAVLRVAFALRSTSQAVDTALVGWMAKEGLSAGKFQVLVALWLSTEALRQKDIVQMLGVSRPTVSALVDALESSRHVVRRPCPNDRRQTIVRLTPLGREVTARTIRSNADRLREALGGATDADLGILTQSLNAVREGLVDS